MTETCHINRDDVARETSVERFGFHNLSSTERASDVAVAASASAHHAAETYGYRNVVATKDAEKEILEAICSSTAGLSSTAREILMSQYGGFKDVLLQAAHNTASLQQSMCEDNKEILLQGCENTDAIKSASAEQFKDVLLQSASNAAAVALQNALNAKDAEISRTINAKDAALSAAVNYERLCAQSDRNMACIQASISECCCEQKELLIERTSHTDALIHALDESHVKEELLAARFKILALESKNPHGSVAA